jgi:hypothetical protein
MGPSPKCIKQLKEIYKREHGVELSDEDAYEEMVRIIKFAEFALEDYERQRTTYPQVNHNL